MEGQNNQHIREDKRQRLLRRNATDAERELWQHLRGKQIDGAKFRRQHPFGGYILDFACLDRRIVIELDGGQHAESQPTIPNAHCAWSRPDSSCSASGTTRCSRTWKGYLK